MKYSLELQIRSISASLSGKGEKRDLSVSPLSPLLGKVAEKEALLKQAF